MREFWAQPHGSPFLRRYIDWTITGPPADVRVLPEPLRGAAAVHYFYMREFWDQLHGSPFLYRYID
jgi:hypothetical protein